MSSIDVTVEPRLQRGKDKTARNPVKIAPSTDRLPRKPPWIRVRAPGTPAVRDLKSLLRDQKLHTVCEEASCPNLSECFTHGTATFMILGDMCTRRCPFCDVAHGKPGGFIDEAEPQHLADAVAAMRLRYVVITSVDRDDLRDGGAQISQRKGEGNFGSGLRRGCKTARVHFHTARNADERRLLCIITHRLQGLDDVPGGSVTTCINQRLSTGLDKFLNEFRGVFGGR